MDPLTLTLLAWIGHRTDYDMTAINPPQIVAMTPQEITAEFYGAVPHLTPEDGVDDRINALYAATDGPHGTIYILDPSVIADAAHFDDPTENPLYREILLHELVHHVQWQTGTHETWACQNQGELEAYHLGGQYLEEVGADDPLPNRNFWAHVYSRC